MSMRRPGGDGDEKAVGEFIGSFYGNFFFWVNIATIVIQALLVSRIVKYLGMAGALFILPVISLGAYSMVAFGAGFIIFRALRRILPAIVFALYSCLFIIIIIITFQFSFSYKKDTV